MGWTWAKQLWEKKKGVSIAMSEQDKLKQSSGQGQPLIAQKYLANYANYVGIGGGPSYTPSPASALTVNGLTALPEGTVSPDIVEKAKIRIAASEKFQADKQLCWNAKICWQCQWPR